jgi:hypothetical protein
MSSRILIRTGTLYMAELQTSEGRRDDFPPALNALIARACTPQPDRPVALWDPPASGASDMRIGVDGVWYHLGSAITREPLVRLFASTLRREKDGGHVLVTPVEKLSIEVDDAPFLAVELHGEGAGAEQILTFRTNVGDVVRCGADHPLRFGSEPGTGGLKPYLVVRGGLEALATRPVMFELVALADNQNGAEGVWSGGAFFAFPGVEGPA